ncbi:MAG: hypothetical protein ICV64_01110 [Thermoleophilia bacterium]|nr:hypothetical protein [Thermoleophilia bacterium]
MTPREPFFTQPAPLPPARERVPAANDEILLVANPNATRLRDGDQIAEARRLLEAAGARVELRVPRNLQELEASFDPLDCGRRIALLGGDGTLHAVANLFPCPQHEIAILPVGGANNVAQSLGVPLDLRAAAENAVRGVTRPLDRIVASTPEQRYAAIEGVSVGFQAMARARYRGENSTAIWAALSAGLGVMVTFRAPCVEVDSDERRVSGPVDQLFVANLRRYAFGLQVAPHADPSDGLADVISIRRRGRLSLVPMLARLKRGSHLGRPGVDVWRAPRLRIDTGGRSPVICDSTNLGTGPVELQVEAGALTVVVPAG